MEKREQNIQEMLESLSINERKILPYLNEKDIGKISKKAGIDEVAVLRALEFLSNKKIIELNIKAEKIIDLGINGILYKQKGLPERRLINLIADKQRLSLEEAKKQSGLSENEFKAALGALKKRALITTNSEGIVFSGSKEEIARKTLEEQFLESLPVEFNNLSSEQKFSLEQLKNRKEIIEINPKNNAQFKITSLGKEIIKRAETSKLKSENLLEALTPEIISNQSWKNKKFRRYDITSPVPKIYGGKRHFVNQATDYARKIWSELGFKEMTGTLAQTGFWNFDALFTAQDHPVREIQDTFYIKDIKGNLSKNKEIVNKVKEAHEKGVAGSKGWRYNWSEEESKRIILRTHTTCLSAQTLASLKNLKNTKDKTGKFFSVGKCFRNETIDWSHGFEFNQTEGIVVDKNANFKNLLGYLKEFARKMGYNKVKFQPSYFPYTEPSIEGYVWNEEKKQWIEVLAAGILRPEVVIPLLGEYIPVLAWGPGFDRMMMGIYGISDIRDLYENDLDKSRKMKIWGK
jgi:phenylalanyl-tRNA synthetase alpha chain